MSETLDLAAIKARADAATPGPWVVAPWGQGGTVITERWADEDAPPEGRGPFTSLGGTNGHDIAFVAAARTDIPALVAEVERLRAAEAAVTARLVAITESIAARLPDGGRA